jgi:hypothetical protein
MFSREIYAALPYAYIGVGLAVLAGLESLWRIVPGLALVGAGLMVLAWRIAALARGRRVRRVGQAVRAMRRRHGLPESPRSALGPHKHTAPASAARPHPEPGAHV